MAITPLTMMQIEEQKPTEPIWGLNNANKSEIAEKGDLLIGIPKLNGSKVDYLKVDSTWLPIEFTRQIPRAQLLASSEFRQAHQRELFIIISNEDAQRLLKREGAAEALAELAAHSRHVRRAGAARTISDANVSVTNTESGNDNSDGVERPTNVPIGGLERINGVDAHFKLWADRLEGLSDIQALNEIRSRRIKKREAKYLLKNLSGKPTCIKQLTKALAPLSK